MVNSQSRVLQLRGVQGLTGCCAHCREAELVLLLLVADDMLPRAFTAVAAGLPVCAVMQGGQ
jgi:hypothetical protein